MVGAVAVTAASFLFVRWRLRRRNRVSPEHPTLAPLYWLVWPGRFAVLHRRLQAVVGVARALAPSSDAVTDMTATVESQAVALDRRLVLASRLRRQHTIVLPALQAQVDELEAVTVRLGELADRQLEPARLPTDKEPLAQLGERLDALEAARAELGFLERDAGLAIPGS